MKTVPTSNDVMEFLQAVEPEQRRKDGLELLDMFVEATGKPAVMWGPSIVGFGSYHYTYDSGREGDMAAAGFSPRKSSLTIYAFDGSGDDPTDEELQPLGKFTRSKACLYIKTLDDINREELKKLIKTSYEKTLAKWAV